MFYQNISGDDATVALMAKHILHGENWPVFFYRQAFMGSLNGVHMVPALFVFGPSVLLVRLNVVAWSLLFPLGLYYLTQPDPGQGNLGSARRFLQSDVDLSWARMSEFLTNAGPLVVGTYYWDPNTPLRVLALGCCVAVYATAVVLAGVEAVRAVRGGGLTRRGLGLWLLLLTLVATYLALYGSTFNLLEQMSRGRYLLPAYIPLLLFLGAAVARLARRSRWAAGVVLGFVLAFNLWTNLIYLSPLRPDERARRSAEIAARHALGQHLEARTAEAILVDDPMESLRWQFLLSRPRISALGTEVYYPAAAPTDAADRVALLASRDDTRIPASLEPLGTTATATQFGQERLYEDVRVPVRVYRLLPRAGWRALGESDIPPAAADGDLDRLATAATRSDGSGRARPGFRRAPAGGPHRVLAHGARRCIRAARGRRLDRRGRVGASRGDSRRSGAARVRRGGATAVPHPQWLARARDDAAARAISADPPPRARLGRGRDGG